MKFQSLLNTYPIISDQITREELAVLLELLERQLIEQQTRAVVEFGCYIGTTALFIRRLLDLYHLDVPYHVYDSFEGLPDKHFNDLSPAGEQFVAGELAVSKKSFVHQFNKAHVKLPTVHKAWFSDIESHQVPENISFAFLDGDYYGSIKDSLRLITPKLSEHAIIVVDDYANEALPGAARAVNEWLSLNPYNLRVEKSLAIIRT